VTAGVTRGAFFPILEFSAQAFIAAVILAGSWRAIHGHMEPGLLITFFFLAQVFFQPIQPLGMQYDKAMNAMAGAERIFDFLDVGPSWEDPPEALSPTIRGEVAFEDVSFSYKPGRPVLQDLSFRAEAGKTVALVGHTGSGKTSIINLLTKFYPPDSGRILIDGVDLSRMSSESLHRQTGIVLQDNFLFDATVAENIRVARPSATDEDVIACLDRLEVRDLVEALPDGIGTQLIERGASLSLGQRQVICFARAMLADPRILILDEATSSVDSITESRVQHALEVLLAERTSFVVAHRLSTIQRADLILVLEHGRIVERGDHESLLLQGGPYADLYLNFVHNAAS
jgi:ATP-binding cassette subfamily B protein